MIALWRPSPTLWVGVIPMSTRPTASRPARYSANDNAPAMQPTKLPRAARCVGRQAVVGHDVADRPSGHPVEAPGRSRRRPRPCRSDRLITQLLMTTSTEPASSGIASIRPLRNSTLVAPASARVAPGELEHLVGHVETEREPALADPLGREQHVDPAARSEVEDDLAGLELGDGGRVAAAQAGKDGRIGQARPIEVAVEQLPERHVPGRAATAARRRHLALSRRRGRAARSPRIGRGPRRRWVDGSVSVRRHRSPRSRGWVVRWPGSS